LWKFYKCGLAGFFGRAVLNGFDTIFQGTVIQVQCFRQFIDTEV